MLKQKTPIRRLLDRLQNRFARSRPGSVLVLVVALLVLMALIGTAYITTARTDRFSAQQNALNTQVDLLLQGVINMAEAAMTTTAHQQAGGQHWDDTRTDTWLSSRIPGTVVDACGPAIPNHIYMQGDFVLEPFNIGGTVYVSTMDNNPTGPPGAGGNWVSIGTYATFVTNPPAAAIPAWSALSAPLATNAMYEDPRTPSLAFPGHNSAHAGIVALPTAVTVGGKVYPALQFYSPATGALQQQPFLAASASGDGIADSFLWRLPIGEINGVTYYAATRIIDNNAAINLNTALSSTFDFDFSGKATTSLSAVKLSPGIFPGNIGLAEMLKTFPGVASVNAYYNLGTEMANFDAYRTNLPSPSIPYGINGGPAPMDDTGTARADFRYNTVSEAFFMGMGRRLNNPGFSGTNSKYQTLSWGEAATLAFKFDLVNANASQSTAEKYLAQSLYTPSYAPTYRSFPYDPSQVADLQNWYLSFQAQPYKKPFFALSPQFCLRPFVTPHNPLNNLMPAQKLVSTQVPPAMGAFNPTLGTGPRISLNTAGVLVNDYPPGLNQFPQSLWQGFYNAMYSAGTFVDATIPNNPQALYRQFRSSLRDLAGVGPTATTYFNPAQQVAVRSLIAAVNAKDLRDNDDNVESRTVPLAATISGTSTAVNVTVFGTERQPYITEVYANNDNTQQPQFLPDKNGNATQTPNPNSGKMNPKGYVAIELHNPYPFPVGISLSGYQLGILNRSTTAAANAYPKMKMLPISGFIMTGFGPPSPANTIPPYGYAILENYQATPTNGNDAQYRPQINYPGYKAPANSIYVYVQNLHEVFSDPMATMPTQPGGELFLLKGRSANGILQPFEKDGTGLPFLANLVPVDSFDFSGTLMTQPMGATKFQDMHYVRANGIISGNAGVINNHWRFVYPGRWTGNAAGPRQEGIYLGPTWVTGTQGANSFDPWITAPPGGAGGAGPVPTPPNDGSGGAIAAPINLGNPDPAPSYLNKFPPIQLNNTDFGGPNKIYGPPMPNYNTFPYGGFARLGDVLQVPFIGGYTVSDAAGNLIEMNAVTMDSSFADDQDGGLGSTTGPDDAVEQIGRFCPLTAADPLQSAFNTSKLPLVLPPITMPGKQFFDPYAWAASVMDCFTVIENPHDDYMPNVDPYWYGRWWDTTKLIYHNPPSFPFPTNVPNLPKLNASTANQGNEDLAPIEGLININTAPFAVLRRVPFVPNLNQASNATINDQIAMAIVTYRNSNGPYKTLFDLNNVPGFQSLFGDPSSTAMPPMVSNYDTGDMSIPLVPPPGATNDGVIGDFEKRFMVMTRVSNLLTTRSDTYTAYILVQGWRGVGTASPELVVQRRAAFIADRSGVTASNSSLNIVNVQAN